MIDLERFPTSEAAIRMLKTVSSIYGKAYVGKWLYQVMGLEIDEAWKLFEELRLQAFPETATWGIIYWEQRYSIIPDDNLSTEERRQHIIVKRSKRSPMNPEIVKELSTNSTKRPTEVIERNSEYAFTILIGSGESLVDFRALIDLIKSAKPSHLAFNVIFETKINLVITEDIGIYRFEYELTGTGQTGEHPETNIIGASLEAQVVLDTNMNSHLYPYEFAGTEPDTNTIGGLSQSAKGLNVAIMGSSFGYQLCGESERDL